MNRQKKFWIVGGGLLLLFASFVLNESFKNTLQRRRAIRQAKMESERLNKQIHHLENQVVRLQKNPAEYEDHVRRELGYLRPGEKEVRFIRKEDD